MTDCILSKCAHAILGSCKHLVHASGNLTIEALRKAGKITTRAADGDGKYLIARAIHIPKLGYHQGKPRLERAMQIGRGINLNRTEEQFA